MLRNLKIAAMIIFASIVAPALLSIIFSGFRVNVVSIVNFQFLVGIMIAVVGGIMYTHEYSKFKKKVITTSMDEEIKSEKDPNRIPWGTILLCSGLIVAVIAVGIGEIF